MNNLLSIDIEFENCLTINVPASEINSFSLEGITQGFHKGWHDDNILETETAEDTVIILKKESDYIHKDELGLSNHPLFERITKYNDIAAITIIGNETEKRVFVKWHRNDEYKSRYQSTALLNDGSLIVVISRTYTAKDIKNEIEKVL